MPRPRPNGAGSVTSRDVARAANVSQALVSRAFAGGGRIAPETRQRILDAAQAIGWQPNALARSMVTGDAPLVAVVTARLDVEWRAQVLSRLLRAVQDWQLKPLLFHADDDAEVDRLLAEAIGWRIRGVIVTAGSVGADRAAEIVAQGRFLAALNRSANHPDAVSVATDNALGGRLAADLLAGEGRERFLVLAGPPANWAGATRTDGFLRGLASHGRAAEAWHDDAMTIDTGLRFAERFLALPADRRPDAVFATNDAMALGFLDGLRGRVEIPRDLSLVGFDNVPTASWMPYRLTTFEQPLDAMMGCLLARIDAHRGGADPAAGGGSGRTGGDAIVYHAPRLIRRATTRPGS